MSRPRARGTAVLALAVLALASCGTSLTPGEFVPWYASLINRSIDFSAWLPLEYRNKPVIIQRLRGPSAATAGATATWHVFVQDRSPEANLVLVLDCQLQLAWQTTSIKVGTNARRWFVDAGGRLLLDGLAVCPPDSGGSAWSSAAAPDAYANRQDSPWLGIAGTGVATPRNYPIRLCVDTGGANGPAGALYLGRRPGSASGWELERVDTAWNATSLPAVLLKADFMSSLGAVLAPGAGTQAVDITCYRASANDAARLIRLYCRASIQNNPGYPGPMFVIALPFKNLEDINAQSDSIAITILDDSGGGATAASYYQSDFIQNWVDAPGGGYLRILPGQYQGDSEILPLVRNAANGSLAKRVEIRLPSYATSNGGLQSGKGSSIGQQPYLLDGEGWWLAIDGFTRHLYVCAPWWS